VTAQSIQGPKDDPAGILRTLPQRWHEQFLSEYHQALDAAQEVSRFHQLRDVLHLWHLRAVALSHPDFDEAAAAARESRDDEFVPAAQVLPSWSGRL
jgi:hypothetical protein